MVRDFVSAMAIKTGLTDIIPTECGCGQMIQLFQKLGAWVENDAYRPSTGDVIFYDWDDNGVGDDTGWPEHVGIVVSVSGNTIKVIEGNKSDSVSYREIAVNGRYIRGYGVPEYSSKATSAGSGSGNGGGPEILKGRYCNLCRFQALRKRKRNQRPFLQGWKSKGNRHRRGYEAPLPPDCSQWIRIDRLWLGKRLRHCRRLYCCCLWLYCGGQNSQGKELGHKVRNRPDDPELGEVQKIHGTENRRRSRPLERDHKLGENLRS
ncbi:MAG: CHAP domain-containing protein [Enterocloster bolteae]